MTYLGNNFRAHYFNPTSNSSSYTVEDKRYFAICEEDEDTLRQHLKDLSDDESLTENEVLAALRIDNPAISSLVFSRSNLNIAALADLCQSGNEICFSSFALLVDAVVEKPSCLFFYPLGEEEKNPLSSLERLYLILASTPTQSTKKYRDLLEMRGVSFAKIFSQEPYAGDTWRKWNFSLGEEDRSFIERFSPYAEKAWRNLLTYYTKEIYGKDIDGDEFFWEQLLQKYPFLNHSHQKHEKMARENNAFRKSLIENQFGTQIGESSFKTIFLNAENYHLEDCFHHSLRWTWEKMGGRGDYASWYMNVKGDKFFDLVTEDEWESMGYIKPPPFLHENLAQAFLSKKLNISQKAFSKGFDFLARELLAVGSEHLLLGGLKNIDKEQFLKICQRKDVQEWRLDGKTLGHYYAAAHGTKGVQFLTKIYKNAPSWFEDGTIVDVFCDNGLSKENRIKFERETFRREFKKEGLFKGRPKPKKRAM